MEITLLFPYSLLPFRVIAVSQPVQRSRKSPALPLAAKSHLSLRTPGLAFPPTAHQSVKLDMPESPQLQSLHAFAHSFRHIGGVGGLCTLQLLKFYFNSRLENAARTLHNRSRSAKVQPSA